MKIVSSVCLLGLVSTVAFAGIAVVPPRDATPQARLAAKEIARYVYLRTGELPAAAADGNTVFNQTAAMYRKTFALRVADSRKEFPAICRNNPFLLIPLASATEFYQNNG